MPKPVSKAMIKSDAVAAALAHTQSLTPRSMEQAQKELRKERAIIAQLMKARHDLLGIEEHAEKLLDTKIAASKKRIAILEPVAVPATATFPIFDLAPLSWRDAKGLPRLVPFHFTNSVFTYERELYDDGTIKEDYVPGGLHEDLLKCYTDVEKAVHKHALKERKTVTLEIHFTGVIPDDVREKITLLRAQFSDKIYIVAEPAAVTLRVREPSKKPAPPPVIRGGDPLVIGFDGAHFRLIAAFDLTPVEQYVQNRVKGIKLS